MISLSTAPHVVVFEGGWVEAGCTVVADLAAASSVAAVSSAAVSLVVEGEEMVVEDSAGEEMEAVGMAAAGSLAWWSVEGVTIAA